MYDGVELKLCIVTSLGSYLLSEKWREFCVRVSRLGLKLGEQFGTLSLECVHYNLASSPGSFSACNIKNMGVAWVRGYYNQHSLKSWAEGKFC